MQPIVEFTEYPDYEAYRAFYYFSARRRPAFWFNSLCAYIVFPIWTIYFFAVHWLWNPWNVRNSIILLLYILFDIYFVIRAASAPRRIFKHPSNQFTSSRAAFFEDYFVSVNTDQSGTRDSSHRYDYVAKAYETANAFYFNYTDKGWGFFPKKFFAPGQVEALRALITRKFGDRFKSKILCL